MVISLFLKTNEHSLGIFVNGQFFYLYFIAYNDKSALDVTSIQLWDIIKKMEHIIFPVQS